MTSDERAGSGDDPIEAARRAGLSEAAQRTARVERLRRFLRTTPLPPDLSPPLARLLTDINEGTAVPPLHTIRAVLAEAAAHGAEPEPWRGLLSGQIDQLAVTLRTLALVQHSSLGTPAARRLSAEAPPEAVAEALTRTHPRPTIGSARGFWSRLTEAERRSFLAGATPVTHPAGQVLMTEGEPAEHLLVITSGWVRVSTDRDGREQILATRGPGELIGERAALLLRSRSATVITLDRLHGLTMRTHQFAAFLAEHPRVLTILEQQIYERLTAPAVPSTQSWAGQMCSILVTDISEFGARHRGENDRLVVRQVMYEILREAFDASGISWTACHREDRGDGAVIIAPPETPTVSVVDPMLAKLSAGLERHNLQSGDNRRLKLRVALHVAPVMPDPHGVSGDAIVHASRLLEAPALEQRLAESGADLGFIASPFVFETVIAYGPGHVDPASYQKTTTTIKESTFTGWVYLADTAPADPDRLDRFEALILDWVTQGLTDDQMARRLDVSPQNVRATLHRIQNKLVPLRPPANLAAVSRPATLAHAHLEARLAASG
ncbi:cyclic nucleotide-binding domain-containing protein [Spirillospora sp. CA-294931]|uniref:cyclic nucleotide-binding domain-containing protein n=1 Tax=Spirillospora sp. CA-294931 TaxID=3240042 RepID=UPI003D8E5CE7